MCSCLAAIIKFIVNMVSLILKFISTTDGRWRWYSHWWRLVCCKFCSIELLDLCSLWRILYYLSMIIFFRVESNSRMAFFALQTVFENSLMEHHVALPPDAMGKITYVAPPGQYSLKVWLTFKLLFWYPILWPLLSTDIVVCLEYVYTFACIQMIYTRFCIQHVLDWEDI